MRVQAMVISVTYTVLQAAIAALLYRRMHPSKLRELRFVILSFSFAALAAVLGLAWSGLRILMNPLVAMCMLPFVQATFYNNKHVVYKILLATTTVMFASVCVLRIGSEFIFPVVGHDRYYNEYILLILGIYVLCFGWFLVECVRTYRELTKSNVVEPWIQLRYVLLGISCVFAIATAVPPVLHQDQASFRADPTWMLVMAVTNLAFACCSFVAWFVPARIKTFMHARARPAMIKPSVVHNIIEHLGELLAARIGKSPSAAKGLILVSLMAVEKRHAAPGVDFFMLRETINEEVRNRLAASQEPRYNDIVDDLVRIVDDLRSVFVVGRV